jgi:hypothetical protein
MPHVIICRKTILVDPATVVDPKQLKILAEHGHPANAHRVSLPMRFKKHFPVPKVEKSRRPPSKKDLRKSRSR